MIRLKTYCANNLKICRIPLYEGIHDLPAYNWLQVIQHGKFEYLSKKQHKVRAYHSNLLINKLKQISDDIHVKFGFYDNKKEVQTEIEKEYCQSVYLYIKNKDNIHNKVRLEIAEKKLNETQKQTDEPVAMADYYDQTSILEASLGVPIDLRQKTTSEYLSYIKLIKNEQFIKQQRPF